MENPLKKLGEFQTFKSEEELTDHVDWFVRHNYVPKSALRVLRLIEWHAKGHLGACWLKVSTICEKLSLSDSTVRRATRKLVELGILEKVPVTREHTGGDGANIYVIKKQETDFVNDSADDRAEVTERQEPETQEKSTGEREKPKTKYVYLKRVIKNQNIKDYDISLEHLDHTFVRDFVPQEFIETVKPFFDDAFEIENLWKKVVICVKKFAGEFHHEEKEIVEAATKAFKQSILSMKERRIQKEFGGYFYGVLAQKLSVLQRQRVAQYYSLSLEELYF